MEKKEIRKRINTAILAMPTSERERLSVEIQRKVTAIPEFRDARCVAAYCAMPFEVITDAIMREALNDNKILCLPRTNWEARRMDMVRVEDMDSGLAPGIKGIMEPTGMEIIQSYDIDLVIVPGRAFDRSCNRIGQGGGFYDAFLAKLRPDCMKCAVAFDIQILDSVPTEEHDLPVDMIITETEIHRHPPV